LYDSDVLLLTGRPSAWQGVIAPRGLPKDVLRTLETAMSEVVNSEAFQQEALRLKTKAHWMSSEAFRKLYDEELNTYGEILKHSLPQK
jgi:tripartite-type tricarboxylate transporter receptor subunit TctC